MRKISEKAISIIFNNEYVKKYLTKESYLNHLETIFQKLNHQVEYSTENKIIQFFKKVTKKNFHSNFDILDYMKKNISTLKNNYSNFLSKIKHNQKDLYFLGMIYGNLKETDLTIISERLEKYFPEEEKNERNEKNAKLKNNKKSKNKHSKRISNEKKTTQKIMHLLHSHNLIDGIFVFRGMVSNNTHIYKNKNIIGNFFQVGKRDLKENLMMTLTEMIWGNLFKLNINKKDNKSKRSLGNLITGSKKIIDNVMVFKIKFSIFFIKFFIIINKNLIIFKSLVLYFYC